MVSKGSVLVEKRREIPWASGTLVAINVIVFLICTFYGDVLYNKGELDVVSVLADKIGRAHV